MASAATACTAGSLTGLPSVCTTTCNAVEAAPPKCCWASCRTCTDCEPSACQPAPAREVIALGASTPSPASTASHTTSVTRKRRAAAAPMRPSSPVSC